MGPSTQRVKEFAQSLVATRRRRLLFVGAALLLVFFILNAGYFVREWNYQIARVKPATAPTVETLETEPAVQLKPNVLHISSVGIEAPIVYVDVINEAIFQEALMEGVVHFPLTAMPGQPGNVYIFGHSSDLLWKNNPYKNIFATLPHVAVGDKIEITDQEGNGFVYVVIDTFIVTPKDTSVLDQGDGTESLMTLQTSYPFGTALARYIVRAKLQTP